MNAKFRKRILDERCVDTQKYRYLIAPEYVNGERKYVIERLKIELLGTTASIDGWEILEVLGRC